MNFIVDLIDPTYVVASQHFRQLFYRYGSPSELKMNIFYFELFFLVFFLLVLILNLVKVIKKFFFFLFELIKFCFVET
jgi:hypothetical protein